MKRNLSFILGFLIMVLTYQNCGSFKSVELTELNQSSTQTPTQQISLSTKPDDNYICKNSSVVDKPSFFIHQIYYDILDRQPDPTGYSHWLNQLEILNSNCQNETDSFSCLWRNNSEITYRFLKSQEFNQKSNSQMQSDFVTKLYQNILRRPPDGIGLDFWRNQISQKIRTEAQVLELFLKSNEYRSRFVWTGKCHPPTYGITGHPFSQVTYKEDSGVSWQEQINLVSELGMKYYRVDIGIGGNRKNYDDLERLLKIAENKSIELLPVIFASIDRNKMDVNQIFNTAYKDAFEVAKQFRGRIKVWEVANEEDIVSILGPGDFVDAPELPLGCIENSKWTCGHPWGREPHEFQKDRIAISKAYVQGMALGLKAADPEARFIINFASTHYGFIQHLINTGVELDIIGFHWYDIEGDPSETILAVKKMTNYKKEIWLTETNSFDYEGTNHDHQNLYLNQSLSKYLHDPQKYPLDSIMIYELLDEIQFGHHVQSYFGLVKTELRDNRFHTTKKKPAFESLKSYLRNKL